MKRKLAFAAAAFAITAPLVLAAGPAQAIIGGQDATQEYTSIGSLQYTRNGVPNSHRCGVGLINESWVVTAAHCVVDANNNPWDPSLLHIAIGNNDRTLGEHIDISLIVVHPEYGNRGDNGADIAMLKLERDATQPLLSVGSANTGDAVKMVGWGRTINGDANSLPTYLQELDSTQLDLSECQGVDEWDAVEGDLCADIPDGTAGPCNGDSGTPLLKEIAPGRWEILGVTSRGPGTGCLNGPEVYTSTSYYKDWMVSVMYRNP